MDKDYTSISDILNGMIDVSFSMYKEFSETLLNLPEDISNEELENYSFEIDYCLMFANLVSTLTKHETKALKDTNSTDKLDLNKKI